jgi:GAF domain
MSAHEILARLDPQNCTVEEICTCVAQIFGVRKTEVGLLQTSGSLLKFLYPPELKETGAIPLSSSAVAASTARGRRADIFNSFTRIKHSSVFELVKLGADDGLDPEAIQKLMSAPILSPRGEVIGVIQVSRKGQSAATAGPDFTADDLERLKSVAVSIGKLMVGK